MNRFFTLAAVSCLIMLFPILSRSQNYWSPDHVHYGPGGKLAYTPDQLGNIIPDFSNVGYRYGDEPIPDIPVKVEVSPVEGDDGATIQAAIDQVAAMSPDENGFRGAVLLKAGTYEVSGQIKIGTSGIVLRGEGQTDAGTVIVAAGTGTRDLISVDNGASRYVDPASKVTIKEAYVPLGRKYVVVANASGFAEGDQIVLYRPGTPQWITDIKMDQITPSEGTVQWDAVSYSFYFERLVTKVSGDTVFFRNPVVMAMETKYGGGSVYKFSFNRIRNIGIENLCLKSAYQSDTDEEHSWNAIVYYSVENSWVRNVTSWYFAYACVNLERESRLITVENCHCKDPKSLITGSRRYSFNLVGSLNLFRDCTTNEGRHDYVSSSRVCGPNVFTRCSATNTHADIGPHHRWAMGTLFDVIASDGQINVQDRDDMGSGHGWAGANQVFWNCAGSSSVCQSPWTSALNYNFGFQGAKSSGARAGRPEGVWVGHNRPGIFPVSLYEAQLDERMNDTRIFSAYSVLTQLNDSTFLMEFNMPVNASTILAGNFTVGGSAGLDGKFYTVAPEGDNAVKIVLSDIGILPAFSTIIILAENVTSTDGKSLEGITSSMFTEPDKRPVVSGLELTVNNEDGFLVASSTKPGYIYLVKYGGSYLDVPDLDSAVINNLGRKVAATQPGSSVPIYTSGLPGGFYKYYAVDEDGRVSEPSVTWPQVVATIPVTGIAQPAGHAGFEAWLRHGELIIMPADQTQEYTLQVFDVTGRLVERHEHLVSVQRIGMHSTGGIVLIRIISPAGVESRKLFIH